MDKVLDKKDIQEINRIIDECKSILKKDPEEEQPKATHLEERESCLFIRLV